MSAAVLGGAGLLLSGGCQVMLVRRAPLPGLLAVHGASVALVGLFLAIHSLAWSLHALTTDPGQLPQHDGIAAGPLHIPSVAIDLHRLHRRVGASTSVGTMILQFTGSFRGP